VTLEKKPGSEVAEQALAQIQGFRGFGWLCVVFNGFLGCCFGVVWWGLVEGLWWFPGLELQGVSLEHAIYFS